jgi:hypothetical protein
MHSAHSLLLIGILVLGTVTPAATQIAGGEDDGVAGDVDADGVADVLDQCPETPSGELVGSDGCSVCSCDQSPDGSPWPSHRAYVGCVDVEARRQHEAGTLTRKQMRAAHSHAIRSTCGSAGLTRCCVYADFMDDAGRCQLITPTACDAIDEGTFEGDAEDEGSGSCVPNPCIF